MNPFKKKATTHVANCTVNAAAGELHRDMILDFTQIVDDTRPENSYCRITISPPPWVLPHMELMRVSSARLKIYAIGRFMRLRSKCINVKTYSERLCRDGYCVIPLASDMTSRDEDLYREASCTIVRQMERLTCLAAQGGLREDIDCQEICQRNTGRYDVRLDDSTEFSCVRDVLARAQDIVMPIICACEHRKGASGVIEVDYVGAVCSLPGAAMQNWHADGEDEGLYTLFAPLVDITVENGGTEFRPGSQNDEDTQSRSVVPKPRVGDVILFDYRVLHRGLANRSQHPRSILYAVLARPGKQDRHNFPKACLSELIDHSQKTLKARP